MKITGTAYGFSILRDGANIGSLVAESPTNSLLARLDAASEYSITGRRISEIEITEPERHQLAFIAHMALDVTAEGALESNDPGQIDMLRLVADIYCNLIAAGIAPATQPDAMHPDQV